MLLPSLSIDCILFKKKIPVFQQPNVEKMFDMRDKYLPNAKAVFKYFRSASAKTDLGYSIQGLGILEDRCARLADLRIMNRIYQSDSFRKLNFDSIVKLSKEYDLQAKLDEEAKTIDFEGNVEAFVRLYDFRHLKHAITGDKVLGLRVKRFT